jgi:hypothetical protein
MTAAVAGQSLIGMTAMAGQALVGMRCAAVAVAGVDTSVEEVDVIEAGLTGRSDRCHGH